MRNVRQLLERSVPDSKKTTPALFKAYVKEVEEHLIPIMEDAESLEGFVYSDPTFRLVESRLREEFYGVRSTKGVFGIRKLFREFTELYDKKIDSCVKALDDLVEALSKWKLIDERWVSDGHGNKVYTDPVTGVTHVR